ncbi:sulfatase-like hydrolase/transferase [Verrucomicrobiaceae bacterium N1E253]|uniref:Sulfatase-like hydrolase/transferase n=1 Tax=Oceaniferula marina TaxID=2748318 RepID=A0A851GNZ9_9BACT|nr:sulfatase-like hydrolase/transferase [Oceaniferula marina]NWK57591.1 sulfatase-like hydrolase/transferase [Oceaniferula marina]
MKYLLLCLGILSCGFLSAADRPNIIVILVDDMGFSDIGSYGGEIQTPHLDSLAMGGVRFSHFYNASRCCPTRASLMTGLHPHLTGIGHMTNPPQSMYHDKGEAFPNYRGFLNRQCVTLGEMLQASGYQTYLTGKWHLGHHDRSRWPLQRGFEKFYGCISGATRLFKPLAPRDISLGNEALTELTSTTDRPYYTTDAFTDYAIRFIEEGKKEKPFFLYLAYTAPHWPHQAHEEDIDRYRGKYMAGWDALRQQRYKRQLELGLLESKHALSPRDARVPSWESFSPEKQKELDLRMAVYAAMIDRIDQNIGKLKMALQKQGQYENTLILFMSDNGACAEGAVLGRGHILDPQKRNLEHNNNYGAAWANVSSTPFRLYKHFTHEGGAATPFFMHWPKGIKTQSDWYRETAQVIDVVPTLLEVSGTPYPKSYNGNKLPTLRGISLAPSFSGESLKRTAPMFSEHENNAFIIDGEWKLVGRGVAAASGPDLKKWELYNLREDRTELHNLAGKHPERLKQMAKLWQEWSQQDKVYPKPSRKKNKKTK